ncbi:uncharacterized protein STEHIDRAFT_158759 [Stereum hirsutum FP-91666 SS1]|uniref:uncharacterized protein n=1 Tax=Stereum hirsutum (strain FP-91666) TaxID=721885 RepID=UPI000444A66F|nr:uncharacterized protein STEHIDRAFT_158759 [Stereum hirsutum FP-91666 SS1]EIM85067.1 hypothetical protein STEHIDRAFT_158759 [Stereum hirsutum FP-91666 SS1]
MLGPIDGASLEVWAYSGSGSKDFVLPVYLLRVGDLVAVAQCPQAQARVIASITIRKWLCPPSSSIHDTYASAQLQGPSLPQAFLLLRMEVGKTQAVTAHLPAILFLASQIITVPFRHPTLRRVIWRQQQAA